MEVPQPAQDQAVQEDAHSTESAEFQKVLGSSLANRRVVVAVGRSPGIPHYVGGRVHGQQDAGGEKGQEKEAQPDLFPVAREGTAHEGNDDHVGDARKPSELRDEFPVVAGQLVLRNSDGAADKIGYSAEGLGIVQS